MKKIPIPPQYLPKIEPKEYSPYDFDRISRRYTLGEVLQGEGPGQWVVSGNFIELGLDRSPFFKPPPSSSSIKDARVLFLERIGQNIQPTILHFDSKGRINLRLDFEDSDLYAMVVSGVKISRPTDWTAENISKIRITEDDITSLNALPVRRETRYEYPFDSQTYMEVSTWGKYRKDGQTLSGIVVFERTLMSPEIKIPATPAIGSREDFYIVREKRKLHHPNSPEFWQDPIDDWKRGYYFVVMGFRDKIYELKGRNPYQRTPDYGCYGHMLESHISRTLQVIAENNRELELGRKVEAKEFY